MTRRSKRPEKLDKVDTSEEALEKQAKRRRVRERKLEAEQRKIKTERARVLHSFLHEHGSAGLLVVDGVGDDTVTKFREGFESELESRLLLMPADGNIQGDKRGDSFADITLGAISAHRDAFGQTGVLGFEDVDFSGQSGHGTPQVAEHVAEILAATREKPRSELAVVAFGRGKTQDMPTSHFYNHGLERGFVGKLEIILGLDPRGEVKTMLEPAAHSLFVPGSYRPPSIIETPPDMDPGPGVDSLG